MRLVIVKTMTTATSVKRVRIAMIFQTSNDTITMEGSSALLKCEARS